MSEASPFVLEKTAEGWLFRPVGDWRLANLSAFDALMSGLAWPENGGLTLDGSALTGLDSAGLMLIHNRLKAAGIAWSSVALIGFDTDRLGLIGLVSERLSAPAPAVPETPRFLARIGRKMSHFWAELPGMLTLLGQISEGLVDLVRRPRARSAAPIWVALLDCGDERKPCR